MLAIFLVGAAVVILVFAALIAVCGKTHRPPAVRAFEKACEDLRRLIPLPPATAGDLLLDLLEHVLADNGLVCVLDPHPFFRRLTHALFVLVGNADLPIVDAVANVDLVGQDFLDLLFRPDPGFFFMPVIDMCEGSVARVVDVTGRGNAIGHQDANNAGSSGSVRGEIKDLFYDPAGFLVDYDPIAVVRIALVAERSMSKHILSGKELRFQRGLYLAARVFGVPFVEQVFERDEIAQTFFGVLVLCNGNVSDMLSGNMNSR